MARAERTVDASGFRIGARLHIDEALARIKSQPAAAAIWVELDRDCGEQTDELLEQLSHDVSRGFYAAVISGTAFRLDSLSARIGDDAVELVVEADEVERTTALALAIARMHLRSRSPT